MKQLITEKPESKGYGTVVSLMEYKEKQGDKLKEWLAQEAGKTYGPDGVEACLENPYMRLLLKYDGVDEQVKECMFSYTEKVMAEQKGRRINRRNIFTELLCLGDSETWQMIEQFADRILMGEAVSTDWRLAHMGGGIL